MSSGAVREKTPSLGLSLINFNFPNWGDDMNRNTQIIDAGVKLLGLSVSGVWENGTAYIAGQLAVDPDTGEIYRALISHTSSPSLTFANDRAAHPTYWDLAGSNFSSRGEWQPATLYLTGDIAYSDSAHAVVNCIVEHVSSASLLDDIANGKWSYVLDTSGTVAELEALVVVAQTAATNASASIATSAANAANALTYSNNASTFATNAAASAVTAAAAVAGVDAYADAAAASAVTAAGQASLAAGSASDASTSASAALSSANAAYASATSVGTDADDAATAAYNASVYAGTASTKATEAAQSAVDAAASAAAAEGVATGADLMTRATYDPDHDGKVTAAVTADAVAWGGVTGKPTFGTAAAAATGDFATSTQGGKADTAVQPAREIVTGTGLTGGGNLSADRTHAIDKATDANIRAGTSNKVITADGIPAATALVTLTDAATVAIDWATFLVAQVAFTANRTLGNPSNVQVGTTRYIVVKSTSASGWTTSFASNFKGDLPTGTVTSTSWLMLGLTALTSSHIVVTSCKAL